MTKTTLLEEENDDDEEHECFYESRDRLLSLSSSCSCSTSNSDNEDDTTNNNNNNNNNNSNSNLNYNYALHTLNNYDIWISQPSSISERRHRLLRHLGLAGDASLSRGQSFAAENNGNADIPRSVSSDHLINRRHQPPPGNETETETATSSCAAAAAAAMSRSKSDSAAVDRENCCDKSCSCSCSASGSGSCFCSSASASIPSVNSRCVNGAAAGGGGGGGSPNKPPSGKNCRRVDEIRSESRNLSLDLSNNGLMNGDKDENDKIEEEEVCTIRDLDNGKEFVVKEVREDGMWNKLKEVATGRQLTMEEFEMTVGHSPIVQELMRRQHVEEGKDDKDNVDSIANGLVGGGIGGGGGGGGSGSSKFKKKGSWLKSIRSVASSMAGHSRERRSSDERDTSSEKGGRRSSSATDDSQDAASFHGPERVKVRQYGKSCKDLTAVYKTQEIQAHNGYIWSIKFSLDGKYLASAGEDCVIHVWRVVESERKGELLNEKPEDGNVNMLFVVNGSPDTTTLLSPMKDSTPEKKRKGRSSFSRKSLSLDQLVVSDTVFALTEKPVWSLQGHLHDVLDLSWSKSQLLSSSMDKTVRLWDLPTEKCLKIFSHSDYVTCIQFNPVDDRYFISGSLDAKVRIWSIPDRQVVDWIDLHEMVTAACYTPDGQGALVGSYKGSCHLYNTSENKLQQKSQISLQNKKKKSQHKKITGFQFAPGSSSEVLITSADSRIRVVDGVDLVHKFKGFRNATSSISASLTANGKYIVSASEDSHVYIWKNEADCRPNRSKGVTVTHSYELFHCKDVSVAIPWPGMGDVWDMHATLSGEQSELDHNADEPSSANHPPTPVEENFGTDGSRSALGYNNSPCHGTIAGATNNYFFDRISATWPEEKLLLASRNRSPRVSGDYSNGVSQNMSAWGLVIVTAGLRGEIRTFQNFGLPLRI